MPLKKTVKNKGPSGPEKKALNKLAKNIEEGTLTKEQYARLTPPLLLPLPLPFSHLTLSFSYRLYVEERRKYIEAQLKRFPFPAEKPSRLMREEGRKEALIGGRYGCMHCAENRVFGSGYISEDGEWE
jgi:hypothetical protein